MKIEIVYYSKTGNTKKVADAMASTLGIEAKNLKGDVVIKDFDMIFLGSGVYGNKPSKKLVEFIDFLRDVRGKKAAIFGTYGDNLEPVKSIIPALEERGMEIIGSWGCRRRFLIFGRNIPSDNDLKEAGEWARRLVNREH